MNKLSDMRKHVIMAKTSAFLMILGLFLEILVTFFGKIELAILTAIILITGFLLLIIAIYTNKKIKLLTNNLDCNKNASFFVITTDGVNYELNQKIKKEKRKKRVNAIYLVRCIFKIYDDKPCLPLEVNKLILKDILTISKWLKQRGDIDLITFTHGDMHKILSRNFILEPVSSVKKMSCLRWCSITLESRGLLLEKPNDYRYYKLTVKNKNAY